MGDQPPVRRRGRPRHPIITDLATWPKKIVSPAQLACYVGITRRTMYHHIYKGAIPAFKRRGVLMIRIEAAREYANEPVISV